MSTHARLKKAIEKATDPGLRSDNWGYLIDVCDSVKVDAEDRGEYAMKVIEERLLKEDANIILRTLSLIVALAENCGSRLQQAISSKHFTAVLFDLVDDSDVHITVKKEILKTVHQLADSFKHDPSLAHMHSLEKRIKKTHPDLVSEPNVPVKKQMTKQKELEEEKELAEALRLSLLEFEKQKEASLVPADSQLPQQQVSERQEQQTPTVVRKVRAMYDFTATEQDELSFNKGDLICVVEQVYRDWWRGTLAGRVGIFPLNYVTPVTEPSREEQAAERGKEDYILSQRENVDRLQRKLKEAGNSDVTQDQELIDLYGTISPLRPQMSKMLGKYAQKKEDLLSLRQILANAEITYNQLINRASNAYTSPMSPQMPAPVQYSSFNNIQQQEHSVAQTPLQYSPSPQLPVPLQQPFQQFRQYGSVPSHSIQHYPNEQHKNDTSNPAINVLNSTPYPTRDITGQSMQSQHFSHQQLQNPYDMMTNESTR